MTDFTYLLDKFKQIIGIFILKPPNLAGTLIRTQMQQIHLVKTKYKTKQLCNISDGNEHDKVISSECWKQFKPPLISSLVHKRTQYLERSIFALLSDLSCERNIITGL